MRPRLTGRDRLLLLTTLPLFAVAFAAHVHESARTGLAQLPVFAKWQPGQHPLVGGHRLETDSSGSGLELGDRLIRVGDRDLAGVGYIGFEAIALSLTTPGHPVPLVIERGGERHTLALEARPHPQRWARVPILLLIPALCVLLLIRAPGQPDVQRFYLCFMTYAIGQAQFYGGPEWQTWLAAIVWNPASVLMLFLMLRWARWMPPEMPDARRVPAALPWVAAALYALFVRVDYLLAWPLPSEWVPRVSFAAHGLMTLLGLGVLGWNYLHAHPAGQRRLRWILLGLTLGSVPVMAAGLAPLVAPEWQGFRQTFALGFLSSVIWMLGAVLATVRDNAFDVDRLIGATTAWVLAAAGGLAVLVVGVPALSASLADAFGVERIAARIALAALLGALVIPLGVRLRPRVDRVLFPRRVALEEGAARLADELAFCETPEALLERAAAGGAALLGARGFACYARAGERLERKVERGLSVPAALAASDLPQLLRPLEVPAALEPGVTLVVPVRLAEGVDALLCLGPKRSGDIYTTHDANVLTTLAARVEREWLRFLKLAADRESQEKTNLLARASHDLRQPLHAVSLLAEALQSKLDDPEVRALVARIGESTHDLDEMLSSLLDRSQLDAGGVRPDVKVVALADVFAQLERDFAPQAASAGVRLRVAPTRLAVRSDRLLLARILRNLVSNALRYAAGKAVLVAARLRGGRVVVEVRDGGPGIPLESQREIFEAFHQLPGAAPAGLGLGLSIVDGLARLLGHEVTLRSRPGRGSTFALAMERAPGLPARTLRAEGRQPAPALASVKRVLVIDDDPRVRGATAELLRAWGCEVRNAAGGAEAVAALADGWRPDFAIADHHLAGGELGTEVIESLRCELGVPLRAAILLAETTPAELEALRARGDPVLRKPVRPARLRSLLAAAGSPPARLKD
jgi:signal transduction histidine kinase